MSERDYYNMPSNVFKRIPNETLTNKERQYINQYIQAEKAHNSCQSQTYQLSQKLENMKAVLTTSEYNNLIKEIKRNRKKEELLYKQLTKIENSDVIQALLNRQKEKETEDAQKAYMQEQIDRIEKYREDWKEKRIKALEKRISTLSQDNNNLSETNKVLESRLEDLDNKIEYYKQVIENIKKAPNGISFAFDGMPIYFKTNLEKPYGDYTVWYSRKSNIYHTDRFCASWESNKTHIFNVIEKGRPCKKCAEGFFNFTEVPHWFTEYKDLDGEN